MLWIVLPPRLHSQRSLVSPLPKNLMILCCKAGGLSALPYCLLRIPFFPHFCCHLFPASKICYCHSLSSFICPLYLWFELWHFSGDSGGRSKSIQPTIFTFKSACYNCSIHPHGRSHKYPNPSPFLASLPFLMWLFCHEEVTFTTSFQIKAGPVTCFGQ